MVDIGERFGRKSKKGEGDWEVQTRSYKKNKSRGYNMQNRKYSQYINL